MELTTKQIEVFEAAKKILEKESWYQGVCLDNFPTDEEIEQDGIEEAINLVCMETEMWDAWDKDGFIPLHPVDPHRSKSS